MATQPRQVVESIAQAPAPCVWPQPARRASVRHFQVSKAFATAPKIWPTNRIQSHTDSTTTLASRHAQPALTRLGSTLQALLTQMTPAAEIAPKKPSTLHYRIVLN